MKEDAVRFLVMVKADKDSEAGVMPSEQLLAEMGNFNEELVRAGVMLGGEGLHPSSKGARVRFSGAKRTVVDGPFPETKELVAGYWVWQVKSLADAIEWARRCPNPTGAEGELEIRQVFDAEDFGAALTPELREQEERLRAEVEKQQVVKQQKGAPPSSVASKDIFVNLPVRDLTRTVEFFTRLGYTFNPQFTDENATCMIVGTNIYVMLLVEKYFKTFIDKPVVDARTSSEAIIALSAESRDAVNRIVETALAAGARRYGEPKDHGFMYQWGFEDLDGHIWEYIWMDPTAIS
jgi:predicted lactoylglutathione lyase